MNKYREQLLEKIEELKSEFETVKNETIKDIANATPNASVATATMVVAIIATSLPIILGLSLHDAFHAAIDTLRTNPRIATNMNGTNMASSMYFIISIMRD